MLTVETIRKIRLRRQRGESLRGISKELRLSRNTVRKALGGGQTEFSYHRRHQPHPRLGRFISEREAKLAADEGFPASAVAAAWCCSRSFRPLVTRAATTACAVTPRSGGLIIGSWPCRYSSRCLSLRARRSSLTGARILPSCRELRSRSTSPTCGFATAVFSWCRPTLGSRSRCFSMPTSEVSSFSEVPASRASTTIPRRGSEKPLGAGKNYPGTPESRGGG